MTKKNTKNDQRREQVLLFICGAWSKTYLDEEYRTRHSSLDNFFFMEDRNDCVVSVHVFVLVSMSWLAIPRDEGLRAPSPRVDKAIGGIYRINEDWIKV